MFPWRYVLITLGYSWTLWIIAIATGTPVSAPATGILYVLGGLGPTVAWVTLMLRDKKSIKTPLIEAINLPSLGTKNLTISILLATIPMTISWLIYQYLSSGKYLQNLDLSGITSIGYIAFLFIVSVIEETGWRGYAYPRLLESYNPTVSSLLIGLVWSLWHLPLFFIPGTYQNGLGIATPDFWRFFYLMIPNSIIYGWLYRYTGNNVGSSVIYHTLNNATGEALKFTGRSDTIRDIVITILAAIIGIIMG